MFEWLEAVRLAQHLPAAQNPMMASPEYQRPPLFDLGECEVSSAASAELERIGVDPASLFDRHQHGDWGSIWCATGNDRSVQQGPDCHAIASQYTVADEVEVLVITAMDRTRTRLQLPHEYRSIEVTSAQGYAIWSQDYDAKSYLAQYEETVVLPIIRDFGFVRDVVDIGSGTVTCPHKCIHIQS